MRTAKRPEGRHQKNGSLTFAVMLALAFCVTAPFSSVYAKKKKANHGTIKILTTPGGFPLQVDGKANGETTTDYRAFDLEPGVHTIVVSLPNGERWSREISLEGGRIKCIALNYRPGVPPVATSPCPFPINLSAPSTVNEGEVITYTSDVSYAGTSPLNFTWTVSPANARILSGAGSPTITVDSTGLAGQQLSATVAVDDGSGEPACRRVAQSSTYVAPQAHRESPAREFDVCCFCSYNDQKARLDNLAVELQNDPSSTTYILAYAGRNSRIGQADRLGARARDYLVANRGINASRIIVVNGGFREEECVELWIVPNGATPPQAKPTVQPGDVRPTRGTNRRKSIE